MTHLQINIAHNLLIGTSGFIHFDGITVTPNSLIVYGWTYSNWMNTRESYNLSQQFVLGICKHNFKYDY